MKFRQDLWCQKTSPQAVVWHLNDDMFSRLYRTLTSDGYTDGHWAIVMAYRCVGKKMLSLLYLVHRLLWGRLYACYDFITDLSSTACTVRYMQPCFFSSKNLHDNRNLNLTYDYCHVLHQRYVYWPIIRLYWQWWFACVMVILCIFVYIFYSWKYYCQYQCNRLHGKTHLPTELLCWERHWLLLTHSGELWRCVVFLKTFSVHANKQFVKAGIFCSFWLIYVLLCIFVSIC